MQVSINDFKPTYNGHILHKMWDEQYGLGFKNAIESYCSFIETKKKREKLKGKLLLNRTSLTSDHTNQYIQSAIEITVMNYFAEKFPDGFRLEPKLIERNNSDVECQFKFLDLLFNVEVKASSYVRDVFENKEKFSLTTIGRLDNHTEIVENLSTLFSNNLSLEKRFDNNLKSHLSSMQSKLPAENNYKSCNVLIIGCNDSIDIQNHYHYLTSRDKGFFHESSYLNHAEFNLIDIVFLTNLFFKHNYDLKTPKLTYDSWKFEKSFILGFRNPFRKDKKEEHLDLIEAIIPNYNRAFKEYTSVPDFERLRNFIHTELGTNRRIYHF